MSTNFDSYREFVDDLPAGAYHTTVDGKFAYANPALATLLGYHSVKDLREANARFLYSDEADREQWKTDIEKSASGTLVKDVKLRKMNGQHIRVLETARVIRREGIVVGYEGIIVDVTDRLMPIEPVSSTLASQTMAYHRHQESINYVLDYLPVCISRKNRKRRVIWANKMFCKLEQVSLDELLTTRDSDAKLYGQEFDSQYGKGDQVVFETGRPHACREPHRYGDGTVRDVEVIKIPLYSMDDQVSGVEVYFWDNVSLSAPLRDFIRETRIHELFSSTETAIYEQDLEGNYLYVSPSASALLGYSELGVGELNMKKVVAPEYLEIVQSQIRKKINSTNPVDAATTYEIELMDASGKRIPVEVNSRLIIRKGKPSGIIGYIRDLSAEKRRLSEVHHRVKNNLHTVNTLLRRDEKVATNFETATILRDCRSRLLAIADLHEMLYKTKRVDHISATEYFPDFVRKVVKTYVRPWQQIDVRVTVDAGTFLSLDAMIPCTLVLQELLSNSLKHAFPKKEQVTKGSILVSLNSGEMPDEYRLQVWDTGIGLPPEIELTKSKSLGMTLVNGLIKDQLGGLVQSLNSPKGTYFLIQFRDPSPLSK